MSQRKLLGLVQMSFLFGFDLLPGAMLVLRTVFRNELKKTCIISLRMLKKVFKDLNLNQLHYLSRINDQASRHIDFGASTVKQIYSARKNKYI